ncbi:MAG: hypothetical protein KDN05_06375 [Verrucomicrobiae bacterium]|nr:hypothetical protein [Verrucomicrobiae bacterium]MCP5532280.1 hypothetical protein [Akkermansiaceae bacterium]
MLLKFLKPGAHEEPGSLSYLLKNPTARVVRGNPELTQWVIDQTPFGLRQRFVSGVVNDLISLDSAHDELLLNELEEMFLARRPKSVMPWSVIEHTDKGKREFHFVIPLLDLLFGKCIHPYVDKIDRNAFHAWVEYFALRYGLDYPREKLREKPAFKHLRNLRQCDRLFLEGIWNLVDAWVREGRVKTRKDLERHLEKEGHKVRFTKHVGGPLQQPVILGPDGNPLRLTNSIYYHPYFGDKALEPLDRGNPDAVAARLKELERVLAKWRMFRAFNSIGRLFGKAHQKDLAKNGAKKRLKLLMDERLALETQVDGLASRIDFNGVFRSAILVNAGFPTEILTPKLKAASDPKPVGEDDKQSPVPEAEEPVVLIEETVDSAPSVAESKAGPEAFQPPDIGGNQSSTTAAEAPAEPAESTKRKKPQVTQDSPNME